MTRAGDPIELSAREFDLLLTFLDHPRQVLSAEVLHARVWGHDRDGHRHVRVTARSRVRPERGIPSGVTVHPTGPVPGPPVTTPLPPVLPDRLSVYAPGRIEVVDPATWPFDDGFERTGVPTTIPRYGLHVVTCEDEIDPDRVRWLVERATTRPLATRHAHLAIARGIWHLVDGHHALAAHLITSAERIPVRLVRPRSTTRSDLATVGGTTEEPSSPALA